jgi:hypothetical protein
MAESDLTDAKTGEVIRDQALARALLTATRSLRFKLPASTIKIGSGVPSFPDNTGKVENRDWERQADQSPCISKTGLPSEIHQ